MSFFTELKRRNVFRVGIAYVLMGWVALQFADFALDLVDAPNWVIQALTILLVIGLPFVLFFSWAYELTPDGLKKDGDVDRSESGASATGRKLDRVIIVVLVIAVAYFFYESRISQPETEGTAGMEVTAEQIAEPSEGNRQAVARSIAILPFMNMSSDPEQEYFSDGITEEIINAVVKIPGVSVPARTSVFGYKGHQGDIRQVGEELGVEHVLEGSIRSQGNQVRVTAQLIKVDDGFHLWSDTFDRELENIFAVQEEIAGAIAEVLVGELGLEIETVPNQTRNMVAYDLYLQGRALLRDRDEGSVPLFEAAIEADPEFAPAFAALAIALQSTRIDPIRAVEMADIALKLDPENVIALDVKASALRGKMQWLESEVLFEKALSLDPANAEVLEDWTEFLNYVGRTEEALQVSTLGMGIDPQLAPLAFAHAEALMSNGKTEESRAILAESISLIENTEWRWWWAVDLWLDPENTQDGFIPPSIDISVVPEEFRDNLRPLEKHARLMEKHLRDGLSPEELGQLKTDVPEGLFDGTFGRTSSLKTGVEILIVNGEADFVFDLDPDLLVSADYWPNEGIWTPLYKDMRTHPRFVIYLERMGLIEYWDATDWPSWCQRDDAGVISCQ